MRLNFPHEVANRIIDLAFVFRENGMAERVVERDPMWESAIAESLSTVGAQPTRSRTAWHARDPFGREIVKCDPTCTYEPCVRGRNTMTALGFTPSRIHCSGCLECTLTEEAH